MTDEYAYGDRPLADLIDARTNPVIVAAEQRAAERRRAGIPPSEARRLPMLDEVGLGFRVKFSELGVELRIDRLRESRGDTTCELTVRRYESHLLRQRFNLTSGPARTSTARDLEKLPRPKDVARVDWREILEMTCLAVLERCRSGEPFNLVGYRPIIPRAARRLIDPWLPLGRATLIYAPWAPARAPSALQSWSPSNVAWK